MNILAKYKVTLDLGCVCKQKKNTLFRHLLREQPLSYFVKFITAVNWEAILLVTYAILASLVCESRVKQPIRARENAYHCYNLSCKYCTSRHHSSGRLRKSKPKKKKRLSSFSFRQSRSERKAREKRLKSFFSHSQPEIKKEKKNLPLDGPLTEDRGYVNRISYC